jgi:hypothetical protein
MHAWVRRHEFGQPAGFLTGPATTGPATTGPATTGPATAWWRASSGARALAAPRRHPAGHPTYPETPFPRVATSQTRATALLNSPHWCGQQPGEAAAGEAGAGRTTSVGGSATASRAACRAADRHARVS